jgi:ABC-2 type transport system ATP-binding protein
MTAAPLTMGSTAGGATPSEAVLTLDGLGKSFGTTPAVCDLSLSVRPGEVFGLLGPNGAGKTTTIRMICGELRPDRGRILLHGTPLTMTPADRVRVGVCPQELVVWGRLTCQEQLEFVGTLYGLSRCRARSRGEQLLDQLGLAAKRRARGAALSGGQRRRLNLALALVHDPELVVLDEPGAGLDPQSRALVRDVIRTLARSATVVLTTHDMDEADRLSDRVAIVDRGRLLVCDTPAAVRARLGGEIVELRYGTTDVDVVRAAIGEREGLAVQTSPGLVQVRTGRAAAVLPGLLSHLQEHDLPADEVRLRTPSLEDVFLHLTGRSLRS